MSGSAVARLVVLARPRGAALVVLLPIVGFGYALWERGSTAAPLQVAPALAWLAGTWLAGHAGAMWLNAALDRDAGPVLLGRAVDVPAVAPLAGYAALTVSCALAWPLGAVPLACAAACASMSVLYSHPRVALKGRPVGGPLVNGVGYGALSPLAGYFAAGFVPSWRAAWTLALSVVWILGVYFAAQAFQREEDRQRGYRTLVVTHGPAWTLATAHTLLRLAVVGLLAAALVGLYPRALLVGLPMWVAADRHLAQWRATPAADRSGGLVTRLALGAGATVLAAYVDQIHKLLYDLPPGGCGTAWVPAAVRDLCG